LTKKKKKAMIDLWEKGVAFAGNGKGKKIPRGKRNGGM